MTQLGFRTYKISELQGYAGFVGDEEFVAKGIYDALQQQVNALAAENLARGEIIERLIGHYSCAGYHAVQNSENPAQSLLYDAMQAMKKTDADADADAIKRQPEEKDHG